MFWVFENIFTFLVLEQSDLFKVNNGNIRTISEICSKLIVISIANFEKVNAGWA